MSQIPLEDLPKALGIVVEHRDNLVQERTRLVNLLHMHLSHLKSAYKERLGELTIPGSVAGLPDLHAATSRPGSRDAGAVGTAVGDPDP